MSILLGGGAVSDIWERLREPFDPRHVEWRIGRSGVKAGKGPWALVLAYITNRAIMDRLDEVAGPGNWWNEFRSSPSGGVLCGITIRLDDGREVTKWDGAENTDVEGVKGGLSAAMKRAAVQWGIGRYLYDLEEGWAKVHDGGQYRGEAKDASNQRVSFKWDPPELPAWALPQVQRTFQPTTQGPESRQRGGQRLGDLDDDALATYAAKTGEVAVAALEVLKNRARSLAEEVTAHEGRDSTHGATPEEDVDSILSEPGLNLDVLIATIKMLRERLRKGGV